MSDKYFKSGEALFIEVEDWINELVSEMGLDIMTNLTDQTPIVTGYAKSNWIASRAVPVLTTVGFKKKVSFETQESSLVEIMDFDMRQDIKLHITNSVPYIGVINNTNKAAAGFVQRSIAIAKAKQVGKVHG
jgi:hypothetical protein